MEGYQKKIKELESRLEKHSSKQNRDGDWRKRYLEVEGKLRELDDLKDQNLKLKEEIKRAREDKRKYQREIENQIQ